MQRKIEGVGGVQTKSAEIQVRRVRKCEARQSWWLLFTVNRRNTVAYSNLTKIHSGSLAFETCSLATEISVSSKRRVFVEMTQAQVLQLEIAELNIKKQKHEYILAEAGDLCVPTFTKLLQKNSKLNCQRWK
jgi:hypothetical protein